MNRCSFSEESKFDLLNFMKEAHEQKSNKFCDLSQYKIWNKILPLDPDIQDWLNIQPDIIEIEDSDQEQEEETTPIVNENEIIKPSEKELATNESVIDDITYAIKENLETQKQISESVLNDIVNNPILKLKNSFTLLSVELNLEDVINLGESLGNYRCPENVFMLYIQLLLAQKLKLEYSDKLKDLLHSFTKKYNSLIVSEITKLLLDDSEENRVLLQYISGFSNDFKSAVLRNFLDNCNALCENYIVTIDTLINLSVEYDTLNKLIQLLSTEADEFARDKSFGKLLMSALQYLGKNVLLLQQPLKHIIGKHRSIWKIKIQKSFNKCVEDNLVLSQSFR